MPTPVNMGTRLAKVFFDDKKVLRSYARAGEVGLKRVGRILVNASKSEIKYAAPTKRQFERLRDPDPVKRERAAKAIAKARGKRSNPGDAPLARTRSKSRSLRTMEYAFDRTRMAVVYGPVKFSSKASNVTPETLEFGGAAEVFEIEILGTEYSTGRDSRGRYRRESTRKKVWVPVGRKGYSRTDRKKRRRRRVRVGKRPYQATSFKKKENLIRPILAAAWKGTTT